VIYNRGFLVASNWPSVMNRYDVLILDSQTGVVVWREETRVGLLEASEWAEQWNAESSRHVAITWPSQVIACLESLDAIPQERFRTEIALDADLVK
jgi:hypothetical protein